MHTFLRMASVYKLKGRPFYFAEITLPDGTRQPRRSTKCRLKKDAQDVAAEWQAEANKAFRTEQAPKTDAFVGLLTRAADLARQGKLSAAKTEELLREIRRLADPEASTVTLRSFWAEWAERAGGLSESDKTNRECARKRWFKALGSLVDEPLETLTLEHLESAQKSANVIRQAKDKQPAKYLAASTANTNLAYVRDCFADAVARGVIDQSPAKRLKTAEKLKLEKGLPKGVFTLEELDRLMSKADDEWRGMVLAGFYTGLRMMDVARLTSDDIHGAFIVTTSSKTNTNTDTPIHPALMEWMKGKKGPLFPKQAIASKSTVSMRFSALMKKANVDKLTTKRGRKYKRAYHELRHTFNTLLHSGEVDERTRLALSGSSDPKVHARYVHATDETLESAILTLPSL